MEKKKPTIDEIYKLNVDGLFESTANWFDSAYQKSQAEINKDLYNKINNYTSPGESTGGNANLGGLLTSLNNSNLYPSKGYLYYNGSAWEFNTPVISGGGGTIDESAITIAVNNVLSKTTWWGQKIANNKVDGPIKISNGTNTFTIEVDSNGNLKFNGNIYATGGVTALGEGSSSGGSGGSSSTRYPFTIYNGSSDNDYITYDGSSAAYLKFKSGFSISKVGLGYEISATGGSGGVTLNPTMDAMNKHLTKTTMNTPQFLYWDGITYTWKNESEISGSGGSIQVAQTPEYSGGSESWVSATKLRFVGITGIKPTIIPNSDKGCVDVGIPVGGGSGSSGTTAGKLRFYKDTESDREAYWNGESDFRIIFGSGLNVSWDSTTQITLSATGGSSTGGSVDLSSYLTKTEASRNYAAKSHTHSINDIISFTENVKATKVNNATNADKAKQLANPRLIWGQSFNGTGDINGHLYMGTAGGGSIQLWMNSGNMLDRTDNTLHIGYGLKESSDGEINLDANITKIYTDNYSKHYDFKSNVFDVNSNQIHFGSETNGGRISWDAANKAFKIEGNVYATGGITALGVSNNATTSNNLDFTFKSVTADSATFDKLYLRKEYGYGLFVGTKCALWGAIETDAIHFGGNFTQVYMTEWIVLNSNSKQCYFATRIQSAKGLSLLDGYLDVNYNGTTYKFDFAKAKELGLLINTGVKTLSDEVDYANVIQ